jgi:hypothetical protein
MGGGKERRNGRKQFTNIVANLEFEEPETLEIKA